MPDLSSLISDILKLEAAAAAKAGDDVDSIPGKPATEAKIAAAEKSRGKKFHRAYREFLKLHDGWQHFEFGMNLRPTAELTGKKYNRGYIEEMDDDERLTEEVEQALVIGWSENDASLLLLTDQGEVLEWRYDVERRHRDFTALVESHRTTLREMAKGEEETEKAIAASWDPKHRAKAEVALAKELTKALANAPAIERVTVPKPPKKRPAAVAPAALAVKKKKKIVAEVMQHLWLYLGAYPSADEVMAAYRAWNEAYPVKGKMAWMGAGDFFPEESTPDEAQLRAALRVRNGNFGLRVSRDVRRAGGPLRYVLNVIGTPPTEDSSALPRASFCEVIAPVSESPETLFELARELLAILPVRSGHGGYAAYVWDEDSDSDPLPEIFDWCRRFFAIDIGTIDGWLPGTLSRLHGASWLTILGPTFTNALAARLDFDGNVTLTGGDHGTILRAGELSLGDVQRGDFPTGIAEVEAAIAPLLTGGYDRRGWSNFAGTFFDTQSEDLLPMRSHHATALYLNRFLDPASWLAATPREQAEAWLEKLAAKQRPELIREWAAEAKTYIPSFETLLRLVYNATTSRQDDAAVAALEWLVQFADAPPQAHNNLIYIYDRRKELAKAIAFLPAALKRAEENPAIFHNAAWVAFQAGDKAGAMKLIEKAHQFEYDGMDKIRTDKDWAPLHEMAAWKRIFA